MSINRTWADWLDQWLFAHDIRCYSPLVQLFLRLAQWIYGITSKFVDGYFNHVAASLCFTTLVSIVPLLAVSFSVLKAFGVQNQLEPFLLQLLEPLGDQGSEIYSRIREFVDNLQVGVLGSIGIIVLFYTVVALIQKIEYCFNEIWHVHNFRSVGRRFSDYLSAVLIGPVLMFTITSLSRQMTQSDAFIWLVSIQPAGFIIFQISEWTPYFITCGIFAFLYGYIPNTSVNFSAALVGGLFSGIMWYSSGLIFTSLVVTSTTYSAVYSGFAALILFMVWLYVGWMVVLVGGQIAAYYQYPHLLYPKRLNAQNDHRTREEISLEIMVLIGSAHYHHQPPWTLERLEQIHITLRPGLLRELVALLVQKGLLIETNQRPTGYLPAYDIGTLTLQEVLQALQGRGSGLQTLSAVRHLMDALQTAQKQATNQRTIRDLVLEQSAESGDPTPDPQRITHMDNQTETALTHGQLISRWMGVR